MRLRYIPYYKLNGLPVGRPEFMDAAAKNFAGVDSWEAGETLAEGEEFRLARWTDFWDWAKAVGFALAAGLVVSVLGALIF
jgi:hypothetical protein